MQKNAKMIKRRKTVLTEANINKEFKNDAKIKSFVKNFKTIN